jgi:hypothetical protein
VAALLVIGGPAVAPGAGPTSRLSSAPGIQVASFELLAGTVYVNLPDDMARGETVSGTVNPIPRGPAAGARPQQGEELAGYAVELAGQRAAASERVRTFRIPAQADSLVIRLVDPRGRAAGELEAALRPGSPPPAGYAVPNLGQGGAPVRVSGPFDGDLSNSSVRIDGREADPIAESARQLVVRGPHGGAAKATVEVRERGAVVTTGSYRNVDVRLSVEATTLRSGEKTPLTVTVTGLEGLREALPVRLTNRSPTVLRMTGGDEQTLCVRPDEVKVDGSWETTRELTGVKPGGFVIEPLVAQPGPHAESWTAPCSLPSHSSDLDEETRLLEDPTASNAASRKAGVPALTPASASRRRRTSAGAARRKRACEGPAPTRIVQASGGITAKRSSSV